MMMYLRILIVLLIAPLTMLAQQSAPFTINGKLQGLDRPWVYFTYLNKGERIFDSVMVKNGTYQFKGTIDGSSVGTLADRTMDLRTFSRNIGPSVYVNGDSFTITHRETFKNIKVLGSQANVEFQKLSQDRDTAMSPLLGMLYKRNDAHKAGNTALRLLFQNRLDSLQKAMQEKVYGNYVRQNPSGPLALYALQQYAGSDIDNSKIYPLFKRLPTAIQNSTEGKEFQKKLDLLDRLAIGKQAIDFSQNDTAGVPVKLSSFLGKYVLLDFWASWCGPCREENPNLVKAYAKYHQKGFEILGVSLDRDNGKEKWLAAIQKDGLSWTHVSDLKYWNNAAAKTYGVMFIPQNFLIDPQGNIVAKDLKGEALDKKLSALLH